MVIGPRPTPDRFLALVSDLAVEILSPSTERRDRGDKKEIYALNGVDEYWLVDTRRRGVTVFDRAGDVFDSGQVFRGGRIISHVLPDLDRSVEDIFADLP